MKTKSFNLITLNLFAALLFTLIIPRTGSAQELFPNGGFESWHTGSSFECPDSWNTIDSVLLPYGSFTSVTKALVANSHSGSFALKIETINAGILGTMSGLVTNCDNIDLLSQTIGGGIPFTERPDSISGWYKSYPVNGDAGSVIVFLLSADETDTIGRAEFLAPTQTTTYTYFSVPFVYSSGLTPSIANVFLSSSRPNGTGQVGSMFYLDDLNYMTGPIGLQYSVNNTTCNGNDGSIDVIAIGTGPFTYQWNSNPVQYGNILTGVNPGIYSVYITDGLGNNLTRTFNLGGPADFVGTDLAGHFTTTFFRPNILSHIFVDVSNQGCFPLNGSTQLILDSQLNYVNSTPTPNAISGDTLSWNLSSMTYGSPHFTAIVDVTTDLSAQIGDSICLELTVFPVEQDGDNLMSMCYPVINSYDPNDKQVYPQGYGTEGFITANQKMYYTVHFQNTGNAEAYDVYILDTLDSNLDIQTLYITASSHSMTTEILSGNVLKFRFDDIHLADSTSNEPESHGYVMYEIEQNPNLPDWTEIKNTAYIYFDYNPAVITNTTLNTIGVLTDVEDYLFNNVSIYPNPATKRITVETKMSHCNYQLNDVTGKLIQTGSSNSQKFEIDLSSFKNGVYLLTLFDEEMQVRSKIVKQ